MKAFSCLFERIKRIYCNSQSHARHRKYFLTFYIRLEMQQTRYWTSYSNACWSGQSCIRNNKFDCAYQTKSLAGRYASLYAPERTPLNQSDHTILSVFNQYTIIHVKTTFIKCLSGEFKFGQKCICNRNVPTWKFTHNLLHLQIAKKSLVFAD